MRNLSMLLLFTYALIVGCATNPKPAGIQSPPLFQVGQRYVAVSGCLPEYLMAVTARGMNLDPASLNPCFGEIVIVQQIRSDGWLLVTDAGGNGWTLNPASLYAFKLYQPGQRAGR